MKKLIIGLCLMANMVMAAGTSSWHYVMSDGTNALVWMGASATNYLSSGTNAGSFVSTNEWRDIILTGKVSIVDAVETNQPVTLAQLSDAIGGLSVLYASTNKTFAISNYYDARTFLPTHTNSIITTASVTGGMYLAGWISNTNLVSEIRHGVAVITARMMFNSGGGRSLTVKPEIYIRYADNTEPELFETAQQVVLTGTMTEYMTSIDCSTNVLVPPDARLLVKWKAVSANNTPTWSFECGTGYVIAVRMPVASPLTLNARYADVAGFASNATASLSDAGTNYFRNYNNLTNGPVCVPMLFFGATAGPIIETAYAPLYDVAFSDTDAQFLGSFYVERSGTYSLRMIWGQFAAANSAKTMSGKIYIATNDYTGLSPAAWNVENGSNMDLPLTGISYGQTQSVVSISNFYVATNCMVNVDYVKDDNAGGATGKVAVYGFTLKREGP